MASYNRFFLVILHEMLEDEKISLPPKVVRKFGAKIPNGVVFKLPDGMEWEISVSKSERMIWFHKGWREFQEYYLLEHGSLLTLEFDGESAFKVCIYEITAYEINYPCAKKISKNHEFKEKDCFELDPDLLVEARGESSLHDPRPFKKVKLEDPWTMTTELRDLHIVSDDGEDGDSSEAIPKSISTKSITVNQKIQAITCSFKPDYPFFRMVMQSSYVRKLFNLYAPCKFSRKYLQMKRGDCTFKVANGRTWDVSYVQDQLHRARFALGWKEFVLDNHLQVGDVCVFELIEISQLSFKVSIFPVDDGQDISPGCRGLEKRQGRPPSCVLDKTSFEPETEVHPRRVVQGEDNQNCHVSAQERAVKFTSRNPSFVASVYQTHVTGQCCLFLPTSFKRRHLKGVHLEHLQHIFLETSDGKKCLAKLHLNQRNQDIQVRISWYKFIHENNLKKGDFCVFELILDLKITFIVHIFRASDSDQGNSGRGRPKTWHDPTNHVTQNPFFEICISTSSILQSSLHLPIKFTNKYLSRADVEKIMLEIGDRRWKVKLKKYRTGIKLSGGWRTFARDNALQVRDVCIFELVGDDFGFKVSIIRSS